MSRRIDRVEEACKEELSEIIQRELKDPRIGFVTINRVKVSADLKYAQVFVSVMGDEKDIEGTVAGLQSARGYLRSHLGRRLRLKYLPEIEFVHEQTAENALRLYSLIKQAREIDRSSAEIREIEEAARLVGECKATVVLAHQYPDGDAIGSMLGLGLMLSKSKHEVQCSWPEPFELPLKYEFLPGRNLLRKPSDIIKGDLLIAVDCASLERLEDFKKMACDSTEVINIDHHPDNTMFGSVNIVDTNASATAEIVYVVADKLGLSVDREVAECLYSGIVTDTGKFQFSNTGANTLVTASHLVELGVDPNVIYENIYQSDSLEYIRLSGEILNSAVYDKDLSLIYAILTQEALERWGVRMGETEDLIDSLRSLRGHRIAALFKELVGGRIRVSLRSQAGTDVGAIARRLGGGGHVLAAGYTSGRDSFQDALNELKEEIIES